MGKKSQTTAKTARKQGRVHNAAVAPEAKSSINIVADEARFAEVVALIETARGRAYQAVNKELVKLYWTLGEYISQKITSAEWGDGVVTELAASLERRFPGVRGYTRRNLFRMRQFYEAYRGNEKVSPLVTQLPLHELYAQLATDTRSEAADPYLSEKGPGSKRSGKRKRRP